MANVQRVFYIGVSPTPIDPQTGRSSHWVKFTGGAGIAPQFPVNANFTVTEVGHPDEGVTYAVTINAMYGVDGQLFAVGDSFLTDGYARIDAPRETELGTGTLDIFDASVSSNTSYVDAITNSAPEFYWQFNETSGTTAAATLGGNDLTYDSDASTYNTTTSLADGTGFAKNANVQTNRAIYFLPPPPTNYDAMTFTGSRPSTQVVNTTVNLNTSGGFVLFKAGGTTRNFEAVYSQPASTSPTYVFNPGVGGELKTSSITEVTTVGNTSFTVGDDFETNDNGQTMYAWVFEQLAGFMDVVEYTGNATARSIPHSLGEAPGFVVILADGPGYSYMIQHVDAPIGDTIRLNSGTRNTSASQDLYDSTRADATNLYLGTSFYVNENARDFKAFLFGNNSSTVNCGSYTGNGSSSGPSINCGFTPRFILVKNAHSTWSTDRDWVMVDSTHGISNVFTINESTAAAPASATYFSLTGTGFDVVSSNNRVNESGQTMIYMAIK